MVSGIAGVALGLTLLLAVAPAEDEAGTDGVDPGPSVDAVATASDEAADIEDDEGTSGDTRKTVIFVCAGILTGYALLRGALLARKWARRDGDEEDQAPPEDETPAAD